MKFTTLFLLICLAISLHALPASPAHAQEGVANEEDGSENKETESGKDPKPITEETEDDQSSDSDKVVIKTKSKEVEKPPCCDKVTLGMIDRNLLEKAARSSSHLLLVAWIAFALSLLLLWATAANYNRSGKLNDQIETLQKIFEDRFSTDPNRPLLASITPTLLTLSGGTDMSIKGSHFDSGATITIGDKPAVREQVIGTEAIACQAPSSTIIGLTDVQVQNGDGKRSIRKNAVEYVHDLDVAWPTEPTLNPDGGEISLRGIGFRKITAVNLEGAPLESFDLSSNDKITVLYGTKEASARVLTITIRNNDVEQKASRSYTY